MTVNSVSTTATQYLQSLLSSAVAGNSSAASGGGSAISSVGLPQDSTPQLSPLARILGTLQQLQQSDPDRYKQITAQIATNLQSAAQTADSNGNSALAAQLNQLASGFNAASKSGDLPNLQDLAQAVSPSQGHRHHHHHHRAEAQQPAQTGAPSSSAALDPMTIIQNTLRAAGIDLTGATPSSF